MRIHHPLAGFVRKMETVEAMSPSDIEVVAQMPVAVRSFQSKSDVLRQGDHPSQCCLVLGGQLIRSKMTDDHRRQILSFHVSGNLPDLECLWLGKADYNLTAVGESLVGFISHSSLRDAMTRSSAVTKLLWRETLVEGSIAREWEINLGLRDATERVAHLFCEMALRLQSADVAKDFTFPLPWNQHDIADACGLSNVHVNRIIQGLRADGVVELRSKILSIKRWGVLQQIAGFDRNYLHHIERPKLVLSEARQSA